MCGIYKKRDTYHHAEQRAEKAQAYPKMDAGVSLADMFKVSQENTG